MRPVGGLHVLDHHAVTLFAAKTAAGMAGARASHTVQLAPQHLQVYLLSAVLPRCRCCCCSHCAAVAADLLPATVFVFVVVTVCLPAEGHSHVPGDCHCHAVLMAFVHSHLLLLHQHLCSCMSLHDQSNTQCTLLLTDFPHMRHTQI